MSKPVLYLSLNVKIDGPSPLLNNLLSIGIVGFEEDTTQIAFEFESNIEQIEGHIHCKKHLETFWLKPEQEEALKFIQTNQRCYIDVFIELSDKLKVLDSKYKLVWIAYPACFHWMFFKSYYELAKSKYLEDYDFFDISYYCVCINSFFDTIIKQFKLNSKQSNKLYVEFYDELLQIDKEKKNLHYGLFDAKVQGKFYLGLLCEIFSFSNLDKLILDDTLKLPNDIKILICDRSIENLLNKLEKLILDKSINPQITNIPDDVAVLILD